MTAPSTSPLPVGTRITITWEVEAILSVEQAAMLCSEASEQLAAVRGRVPVSIEAKPFNLQRKRVRR